MKAILQRLPFEYAAEALGSFALVLTGILLVWVDGSGTLPVGRLGVALGLGLVLAGVLHLLDRLLDIYLNPAVTVAGFLVGRLTARAAGSRIIAQLVGAAIAGIVFRIAMPEGLEAARLGISVMPEASTPMSTILGEGGIALFWTLAVAATSWREPKSGSGPLLTGAIYAIAILALGAGAGVAGNPAAAFGPAFASGVHGSQLLIWLGPAAGAVVAATVVLVLASIRGRHGSGEEGEDGGQAVVYFREGIALYREGRLEEAARRFALAVESDPDWPEPYCYIGIVYHEFGDQTNAMAFLDVAQHYRRRAREIPRIQGPWR